ncbi:MAG: Dyp-type peroxidase [Rhodococcus sp. (in: high G+C Gram-positive bacteria)]|uniref:Dyp-type peroxidase n=1 Tax=Rhodococcus sp. EPR-157 TaxID=1813677 RepID=UPI0007BAFB80|nr:Dyp-type peroxidase [Rhodococcus sp. EPR-157]KZF00910.1 peroxidase [Rhodococcus sp. EPR-157]
MGSTAPQRGTEISRRRLLAGGVAALGAAGVAYGYTRESGEPVFGRESLSFFGVHQAGIATSPQAHGTFVALDLRDGAGRDQLISALKIWTTDAARLTQGLPALADTEPELAQEPSALTITVGLGPGAFSVAGIPSPVEALPPFGIDRLETQWSDGDVLLQVCADDPLTVAHAVRVLTKNVRTMASIRWVQRGFRSARGAQKSGTTMRNLMGQVDGTVNPDPAVDFDSLVWNRDGGTSMVVRRIAIELDTWDELDRGGREFAVGRTLDTGAPLTGQFEHDEADFDATDRFGIPVISPASHIARARHTHAGEQFFRRAYNYDEPSSGEVTSNSGLIFATFQRDIGTQFLPVQQRLDEHDALNEWTTPIGSAVFAIPAGVSEGGFLGQELL